MLVKLQDLDLLKIKCFVTIKRVIVNFGIIKKTFLPLLLFSQAAPTLVNWCLCGGMVGIILFSCIVNVV